MALMNPRLNNLSFLSKRIESKLDGGHESCIILKKLAS
jgi:hypothetical protein